MLRRTEPQIPVQIARNLVFLTASGQLIHLAVVRGAAGMNLVNVANGAIPYPLAKHPDMTD